MAEINKVKLFCECMESDVKPLMDDEIFEGLMDLLVAIGAECRKCGAKPSATMIFKGESEAKKKAVAAKHWNRRADDGRDKY